MDPKFVNAAATYLSAILGKPAEQLQQLASTLLTAQVMQWLGGNSFSIDRTSPALVTMCPDLLTTSSLQQIGTPEAQRVLRERLLRDPELLALEASSNVNGNNMFGAADIDDLSKQIDAALAAGGVPSEDETAQQRYLRMLKGEAARHQSARAAVMGTKLNSLSDYQRDHFGGFDDESFGTGGTAA